MPKATVHLICNAHLDPVWLWEWEEGAAEAISTFRIAAEFCEKFDGFIFNHNEAILYEWIEDYESELFVRIQTLVKAGKWHIMGGWYLQPDCNMPSGESFIRQILLGKQYFKQKFDVSPSTAINFDPFGHTQGLVQILAKRGYDSYLFCRPGKDDMPLERNEFIWQGYDGSQILATRLKDYNSKRTEAAEKVIKSIAEESELSTLAVAWGVGNHGGGPSKIDLKDISNLAAKSKDIRIIHSSPEVYFAELAGERAELPDANWEKTFTDFRVKDASGLLPSQIEQEDSHLNLDWRKKIVFSATLQASQMNRFDCDMFVIENRPQPKLKAVNDCYAIDNGQMKVAVITKTGLLDYYEVDGRNILGNNAFCPLVMFDNEDTWGMETQKFPDKTGTFKPQLKVLNIPASKQIPLLRYA